MWTFRHRYKILDLIFIVEMISGSTQIARLFDRRLLLILSVKFQGPRTFLLNQYPARGPVKRRPTLFEGLYQLRPAVYPWWCIGIKRDYARTRRPEPCWMIPVPCIPKIDPEKHYVVDRAAPFLEQIAILSSARIFRRRECCRLVDLLQIIKVVEYSFWRG